MRHRPLALALVAFCSQTALAQPATPAKPTSADVLAAFDSVCLAKSPNFAELQQAVVASPWLARKSMLLDDLEAYEPIGVDLAFGLRNRGRKGTDCLVIAPLPASTTQAELVDLFNRVPGIGSPKLSSQGAESDANWKWTANGVQHSLRLRLSDEGNRKSVNAYLSSKRAK